MPDLEPIKSIAGKLLLLFYVLYRNKPGKLKDCLIEFDLQDLEQDIEIDDEEIQKAILKISNNKNDIVQAIKYLGEKHFIDYRNDGSNVQGIFLNTHVTSSGIDIIEGIERGNKAKTEFNFYFNLKVENNMNVDSLVRSNIGSLLSIFGLSA